MEHGACFAGVILSTLEIGIVIRYLVKFLGWKGKEKHRTEKSLGLGILMFFVSQINGLFANSYWIVVLIDVLMLMAFSYINLKGKLMRQIFVSILPFLVVVVTNIWLMQIFAWSREISVLSYFSNLKGIHLTGPILSKIILWIVLEIIIFIWKREKNRVIRWDLCIGVWIDTHSDCDGNDYFLHNQSGEQSDSQWTSLDIVYGDGRDLHIISVFDI